MSLAPGIAVIVFPGSNDDRDAAWALGALGADAQLVWHAETALPRGTGAVVSSVLAISVHLLPWLMQPVRLQISQRYWYFASCDPNCRSHAFRS